MSSEDGVKVGRGRVLRVTEKALLVELDGEERWVPQTVVHDDSEIWKLDDEGELVLKQWFAEKEGFC